jgi:para-nitrobenzyl esterase
MVPALVGANDLDIAHSPARTKEALFALFGPLAWQARMLYDPNEAASLESLIQAVMADRAMAEPSRHVAEAMTHAGQPAYFFRFSYVAEAWRSQVPGATHGSEIAHAFDAPGLILEQPSPADLVMAQLMSRYWVSFVQTGNPNGDDRPTWPPYDPETRNVFTFSNTGVTSGEDPIRARLDLWQTVWEDGR